MSPILPLLRPSAQQDDDVAIPFGEIDPVTRTVVDLHFHDAGLQIADLPGIAKRQAANANANARNRRAILKAPFPPIELGGDLDRLHVHFNRHQMEDVNFEVKCTGDLAANELTPPPAVLPPRRGPR